MGDTATHFGVAKDSNILTAAVKAMLSGINRSEQQESIQIAIAKAYTFNQKQAACPA